MPDFKLTDLPAIANPVVGTDLLYIDRSRSDNKVAVVDFFTSPTFVTPTLGAATATSLAAATAADITITPGGNAYNVVIGNTANGSMLNLGVGPVGPSPTSAYFQPMTWSGGSGYFITGGYSLFATAAFPAGIYDYLGGFGYNLKNSPTSGDVQINLGFESRYQNDPNGVDTEFYYAWNGPVGISVETGGRNSRRIFQSNVSWGVTNYSGSRLMGSANFDFDVNILSLRNGANASHTLDIDMGVNDVARSTHTLHWYGGLSTYDGAFTIGGLLTASRFSTMTAATSTDATITAGAGNQNVALNPTGTGGVVATMASGATDTVTTSGAIAGNPGIYFKDGGSPGSTKAAIFSNGSYTVVNGATGGSVFLRIANGNNFSLDATNGYRLQNGAVRMDGVVSAGSTPTTLTDAAGKILSAALNTVAVANGGSGAATLTGLLQGNGTSAFTAVTNSTTVGQILRVTGSNAYGWGALDLADTDAITGTLPVANGGTGITSLGAGVATFLGTPSSANLLAAVTDETGMGALTFATSPVFTTDITLPNGTSPTTGSVAKVAFDTDAWAASRGAIQVHDGTANTFVVAALASDVPTNGQVPTWNTGGTVTWETPSGGTSGNNSALFTSTADAANDHVASDTSIIGSGVGSKTTPANYFAAGTSIMVQLSGYVSTPATPDTLNVKIKAGATSVGSTGAFTPSALLSNATFRLFGLITCRTAGASGTFIINTMMEITGASLTTANESKILNTATVTLDTTGTLAWDITAAWSSTTAGDVITGTNFVMFTPGTGIADPGANGILNRTALNTVAVITDSAGLATVITDETGSGALVFATSPTLVTPLLGTPTSGVMTNVTGTAKSLVAGNVPILTYQLFGAF